MNVLTGRGNKRLVRAISRSSNEWKKVGSDFRFRATNIFIASFFETAQTGGKLVSLYAPSSSYIDESSLTKLDCRSRLGQLGPFWRENQRLAENKSPQYLQVWRQPRRKRSIPRAWHLHNLDSQICAGKRSVMSLYECNSFCTGVRVNIFYRMGGVNGRFVDLFVIQLSAIFVYSFRLIPGWRIDIEPNTLYMLSCLKSSTSPRYSGIV